MHTDSTHFNLGATVQKKEEETACNFHIDEGHPLTLQQYRSLKHGLNHLRNALMVSARRSNILVTASKFTLTPANDNKMEIYMYLPIRSRDPSLYLFLSLFLTLSLSLPLSTPPALSPSLYPSPLSLSLSLSLSLNLPLSPSSNPPPLSLSMYHPPLSFL